MPDTISHLERVLIDYETTNRTDYQKPSFRPEKKTIYKQKKTCMMVRPAPLKDIHTMTPWKTTSVPFNLILKRKDIVQTNPRELQKPFNKPVDFDRESVQKSRPRLVMTPAVSMDDIADDKTRDILCRDIYTSEMSRALREAVSPYFRVEAPLPGLPAPSNPIVLKKINAPYVSPEWRMESITWENEQLRAFCEPTKRFWQARPLFKCRACDETAKVKAERRMDIKRY